LKNYCYIEFIENVPNFDRSAKFGLFLQLPAVPFLAGWKTSSVYNPKFCKLNPLAAVRHSSFIGLLCILSLLLEDFDKKETAVH
jgi:hypothetical protein